MQWTLNNCNIIKKASLKQHLGQRQKWQHHKKHLRASKKKALESNKRPISPSLNAGNASLAPIAGCQAMICYTSASSTQSLIWNILRSCIACKLIRICFTRASSTEQCSVSLFLILIICSVCNIIDIICFAHSMCVCHTYCRKQNWVY